MRGFGIKRRSIQGRVRLFFPRRVPLALALGLVMALLLAAAASGSGVIKRLSTDSAGGQGNSFSNAPSISADGRYVSFESNASNLVAGDTNGVVDVFVKNTSAGATIRVSTDSAGGQGNGVSIRPSISADGRYVAFQSLASNLVAGDTNGMTDIFVKDTATGATTRVSTDSAGSQVAPMTGGSFASYPSISADGRYVAFNSDAADLVAGDTNGMTDIFVKDTATGATTRVSTDPAGGQGDNFSAMTAISADGRYVAFQSLASNLVAGDTNGMTDIFVKDILTGAVFLASAPPVDAQGNGSSYSPAISADGRYVVFESSASNLVAGDTNGSWDFFRKDVATGAIIRVSTDSAGGQVIPLYGGSSFTNPSISADGRYVAFKTDAANLVAGDTNGVPDVFVKDAQTDAVIRVSTDPGGGEGNQSSYWGSISADSRYVAFTSHATNLIAGDTNSVWDIFLAATDVINSCGKPSLSTTKTGVYWASYADYLAHLLSVSFNINNSGGAPAYMAQLQGAVSTNGVTCATPVPVSLGNIPAGSAYALVVKYSIPVGTGSFSTTIYTTAKDGCNASYSYPGPYPGTPGGPLS